MEITLSAYKKLKSELDDVEVRLDVLYREQAEAREFGDLRENEEYQSVSMEIRVLSSRKVELTNILKESSIVSTEDSVRFSIGSLVKVQEIDDKGKDIGSAQILTLEEHGDPITKKVLGASSPLGQAIINSASGIFDVQLDRVYHYRVGKVYEEG